MVSDSATKSSDLVLVKEKVYKPRSCVVKIHIELVKGCEKRHFSLELALVP